MNIITGYRAEPHVTAQQDRNAFIGIFGRTARIIKGVGSEAAATIISANEIEIADGMVCCQGCMAEITRGTSETMLIENGDQGQQRVDLIVVRYTKDSGTGVEDMGLTVIKGAPAASNPAVPEYNTGTIADGDSPVDFPLYRVNLDGINISSVVSLMDPVSVPNWVNVLTGQINTLQTRATNLETRATNLETKTNNMHVRRTQYSFGSLAFDNTGAIERVRDVSDSIPDGYTMIDAHMVRTGSYAAYCYTCEVVDSTRVHIQLFRPTYTSVTATTPEIALLCVKNL